MATSSTRRGRQRASATSVGRTRGTVVQFADGTIPHLPIATAEIQGYVYDAKLRVAELARRLRADIPLAERLERDAQTLYTRFNADFWSEDRGGYYVVGLDGDKRRIDSMTSNMGHLLWSGIVPEERAALVAGQLMSDAMFSGWGVRTLSTDDRGYNPIGYHIGTIWPHDNAIIALGLARRLPRRGEPDRPGAAGGGRLHRPPAGGVRGLRALGQPLSPSPTPSLQPPGVGHRCPFRLRAGDARSRGPRRQLHRTRACPRSSVASACTGCMRSVKSESRRSAPKATFAAPRGSQTKGSGPRPGPSESPVSRRGISARMRVPRPGALSASRWPSSASTRAAGPRGRSRGPGQRLRPRRR